MDSSRATTDDLLKLLLANHENKKLAKRLSQNRTSLSFGHFLPPEREQRKVLNTHASIPHGLGQKSDDVVVSIAIVRFEPREEKRTMGRLSGFFAAPFERLQDGAHACARKKHALAILNRVSVFFGYQSVLSGLNPATILEICSRAISFWQYQIHQEK